MKLNTQFVRVVCATALLASLPVAFSVAQQQTEVTQQQTEAAQQQTNIGQSQAEQKAEADKSSADAKADETKAAEAKPATEKVTSDGSFVPSEEISEDLPVSFPVDI